MGHVILKKLRVYAFPDGRLTTSYREGARPPVDEEWWQHVLHDPRARTPAMESRFDEDSPYPFYRLDRQRGAEVVFNCACGRSRIVNRAELIEALGGDCNVNWAARKMIDCPRKNKIGNACLAYCIR